MDMTNRPQAVEVSWDDDRIQLQSSNRKFERFKAKGGVTSRILILDANPVTAHQHYKDGFGYIRCLSSIGQTCAACNAGDKASQKFGVNVLLYAPKAETPAQVDSANVRVLGWLFGVKTFSELRNIKGEWGDLTAYDLKVNCTNEQFQHVAITPCRESLVTAAADSLAIQAKIEEDRYDLKRTLGRTFEPDQVAGIWSGSITPDDIFKKSDGSSASSPVTAASSPINTLAAKLDFNKLLGN